MRDACCAGYARGGAVPLFAIVALGLRAKNALTAKAPEITTAHNLKVSLLRSRAAIDKMCGTDLHDSHR